MRNNFWIMGKSQRPLSREGQLAQQVPDPETGLTATGIDKKVEVATHPVSTQVTSTKPLPISPLRALVLRDLGSVEEPPFPGLVDFPDTGGDENKKLEQGQVLPRRKNKWLWWPKKYQNLYKSVRF